LKPDEKPENRFVYSKEDLVKFQREQSKQVRRAQSIGSTSKTDEKSESYDDEDQESTGIQKLHLLITFNR
jgi:hypothetical protein